MGQHLSFGGAGGKQTCFTIREGEHRIEVKGQLIIVQLQREYTGGFYEAYLDPQYRVAGLEDYRGTLLGRGKTPTEAFERLILKVEELLPDPPKKAAEPFEVIGGGTRDYKSWS